MKEIDRPVADEVNGGFIQPPVQQLPFVEPIAVKVPGIEIEYNPSRDPQ